MLQRNEMTVNAEPWPTGGDNDDADDIVMVTVMMTIYQQKFWRRGIFPKSVHWGNKDLWSHKSLQIGPLSPSQRYTGVDFQM